MLETFKRIDLSRIREAFEAAGIEPSRYLLTRCVMAAINHPNKTWYTDKENSGFDKLYVYGVIDGWDERSLEERKMLNKLLDSNLDINSLKYKLGVADGEASRRIMNPL